MQAISGFQRPFSHPSISSIKRLTNIIIMSGSKVSIIWIPSHVGIEGNEMADKLANSAYGAANRVPSTQRTESPSKAGLAQATSGPTAAPKQSSISKPRFQALFFFHRHRRVSIVLHRPRNGHNRLKSHTSRFKTFRDDIDGSFRDRFCPAFENASHVIIVSNFFFPDFPFQN